MRAQLRSVDTKLKDLASALNTLAPAPTQDSETIIEPDSEHYRESDFYEEPNTPLHLANKMRQLQTTGEVWLAAFHVSEKKIRYRAIYSLNPINPLHTLNSAAEQFMKYGHALFLRVPKGPNPFVMYVTMASVWKSEDPIQVLSALHEFGMEGLVTIPNPAEVEG